MKGSEELFRTTFAKKPVRKALWDNRISKDAKTFVDSVLWIPSYVLAPSEKLLA
jgi:hypothetical protein